MQNICLSLQEFCKVNSSHLFRIHNEQKDQLNALLMHKNINFFKSLIYPKLVVCSLDLSVVKIQENMCVFRLYDFVLNSSTDSVCDLKWICLFEDKDTHAHTHTCAHTRSSGLPAFAARLRGEPEPHESCHLLGSALAAGVISLVQTQVQTRGRQQTQVRARRVKSLHPRAAQLSAGHLKHRVRDTHRVRHTHTHTHTHTHRERVRHSQSQKQSAPNTQIYGQCSTTKYSRSIPHLQLFQTRRN